MGHIISKTAEHRPALRRRRFRHDNPTALDLFSGFGGFTQGIEAAGFDTIVGANHNRYKVEVHEANHPHVEHWIADLINTDSDTYHSVRELPPADLLVAGVTCTNHSQANTQRAYAQGLTLFDLDDPEFEERATRSERDRATANCVLHYADQHHPLLILVECTTELQSWGPAVPGRRKVGDGSTYRWWLREITKLGYEHKVLYLNSMFFGVPQSRDRLYIVFWDRTLPAPDLDHRPQAWCGPCDEAVEAMWAWKTGVPASGSVRYGKQYNYRCPRCFGEVSPTTTPSLTALDLTHLGTRIGDRAKPLAPATMARAERCRQKFAEFPAVLMPAKAQRGVERHPLQPMSTQNFATRDRAAQYRRDHGRRRKHLRASRVLVPDPNPGSAAVDPARHQHHRPDHSPDRDGRQQLSRRTTRHRRGSAHPGRVGNPEHPVLRCGALPQTHHPGQPRPGHAHRHRRTETRPAHRHR